MATKMHLNLLPPLSDTMPMSGHVPLCASFSSSDNSLAAFATDYSGRLGMRRENIAQSIYLASMENPPSSERRLFISDTSVIFAAFQNLMKNKTDDPDWARGEEVFKIIRKLAKDYLNHIKECWVHASQPAPPDGEPLQLDSDHYRMLYTSFSLFVILYLPEPAIERVPVGDDLMEWLNIHFIEPTTEEGDHLSGLERPWEDESFWPYLTRAVIRGLSKASAFFLDVLRRHPSEHLQPIAERLIPLVGSQPRILNFKTEREFVYASRRWNDKVKATRIDMDRVPESKRSDMFSNWWDRLSDIVAVLEGRGDVISRVCDELGADWKEVVAAWCIFVDPRVRRDALPDVVGPILNDKPPDPTDWEDMIHAALLTGQTETALSRASELDRWLAAHMADIMHPLGLLSTVADDDDEPEMCTRDLHVFDYANYLRSDSALWQLTLTYMYTCGEIGAKSADEVLLRVPLRLVNENSSGEPRIDAQIRAGEVTGVLKAVNESCLEFQREHVRRTVCKIAAQTFIREKEYGLAVSFYTSAEDWSGLGRVIDCVLDEYVANGPEQFVGYVTDIPSVQTLQSSSGFEGLSSHRLEFTIRYAEFQRHRLDSRMQDAAWDIVDMFNDEIPPKSWWAVLLHHAVDYLQCDFDLLFTTAGACELARRLEEVIVRSSQGAGEDYLTVLSRVIKGGEKESLQRLMTVRYALVRYFARCTTIAVGGIHAPEIRSNV